MALVRTDEDDSGKSDAHHERRNHLKEDKPTTLKNDQPFTKKALFIALKTQHITVMDDRLGKKGGWLWNNSVACWLKRWNCWQQRRCRARHVGFESCAGNISELSQNPAQIQLVATVIFRSSAVAFVVFH